MLSATDLYWQQEVRTGESKILPRLLNWIFEVCNISSYTTVLCLMLCLIMFALCETEFACRPCNNKSFCLMKNRIKLENKKLDSNNI